MKKIKIFITLFLCTAMAAAILTGCANASDGTDGDGTNVGSYIGTKAPSEAKEVGDIVFNDGSAMPYATFAALDTATKNEKKTSAIALIFYKGTETSNVAMSVAPLANRTLGVGLKHSNNTVVWCTENAQSETISIDSIYCDITVEFTGSNFPLSEDSDKDGSDNLEQIASYLVSQSIENDTGVGANTTKTPQEGAALYPAFYYAKNYASQANSNIIAGSEYANGWYLPSLAELLMICKNGIGSSKLFDIDAVSNALGGDQFGQNFYWSSSSEDWYTSHAWTFGLPINNVYAVDHTSKHQANFAYACAIRVFN